jgi:hypothetical protein
MLIGKELRLIKLQALMRSEGYRTLADLLRNVVRQRVGRGICIKLDCDGTTQVEPDQTCGYCEACRGNTVVAAPILAGII